MACRLLQHYMLLNTSLESALCKCHQYLPLEGTTMTMIFFQSRRRQITCNSTILSITVSILCVGNLLYNLFTTLLTLTNVVAISLFTIWLRNFGDHNDYLSASKYLYHNTNRNHNRVCKEYATIRLIEYYRSSGWNISALRKSLWSPLRFCSER